MEGCTHVNLTAMNIWYQTMYRPCTWVHECINVFVTGVYPHQDVFKTPNFAPIILDPEWSGKKASIRSAWSQVHLI
jgi:hypothetical protein